MSDGWGGVYVIDTIQIALVRPAPKNRAGASIQRLHTFASVISTSEDDDWQRMRND